jgi:LmbE family N-acetylglucosaminyl deacetylase
VFLASSPRGVQRNISEEEKRRLRQKEGAAACKVLGAKAVFLDLDHPDLKLNEKNVALVREKIKWASVVFTHSSDDSHPTHRVCHKIAMKAVTNQQVWFFEGWSLFSSPDYIYLFGEKDMGKKMEAMEKHASQLERNDFLKAIIGLNTFRGVMGQEMMAGFGGKHKGEYGEAFLIPSLR